MNVNLTPELERLVQEKVRSGMYGSPSEVVREALRRMVEQDARRAAESQRLRGALAERLARAERGELEDGEAALAALRGNGTSAPPESAQRRPESGIGRGGRLRP